MTIQAPEISERGFFWRPEDTVLNELRAPQNAIPGSLKLDTDGTTVLTLDGVLPRLASESVTSFSDIRTEYAICGLLISSGKYIRLGDATSLGHHISSRWPPRQTFRPTTCLLSDAPNGSTDRETFYTGVKWSLAGFGPWLDIKGPQIKETLTGFIARSPRQQDRCYRLRDGNMKVHTELTRSRDHSSASIVLGQNGMVTYTPLSAMTQDDVQMATRQIEDLLVLLTDFDCGIGWPQVQVQGRRDWDQLFYGEQIRQKSVISISKCWIKFPEIADQFGQIADNWITKHKEVGPGFYLYLGNRRDMRLYLENRFTNLIWGLESLHRNTRTQTSSDKLKLKIARILVAVDQKDRHWLKGRLAIAHETPLADRLNEIFCDLPLCLDSKALKNFAKDCAYLRNNISHFGGVGIQDSYKDLVADLTRLTSALEPLYHACILREIGVPDILIRRGFTDGHTSVSIRHALKMAGLILPPSI
jgi:hypothetical protein